MSPDDFKEESTQWENPKNFDKNFWHIYVNYRVVNNRKVYKAVIYTKNMNSVLCENLEGLRVSKKLLKIVGIDPSISGNELKEIMGLNPKQYGSFSLPRNRRGHTYLEPKHVFDKDRTYERFPRDVQRVNEGDWRTGEVWTDTFYGGTYLYVGRTPEGKDVVVVLDGNTPYSRVIKQGVINSGDRERISFDQKLFP